MHCARLAIDTDIYSDSFDQKTYSISQLSIEVEYQNNLKKKFNWNDQFKIGMSKTICVKAEASFGNVTNVFLRHNQRSSLGLKVKFIQIQKSPGSEVYTSWVLGSNNEKSFWITNKTCETDTWCQLTDSGI